MRQTSTETISPATAPPNFALFKRDSKGFWPGNQDALLAAASVPLTLPIPFLDMPAQDEPGSDDRARMSVGETAQHPTNHLTTRAVRP